ncbi:MAG: site-2 protease family protein [Candidatus Micrarchaeota archaeon]|nr:site-2 protease family protein [Candidatus Micrarchaeota archaeon]
MKTARQKAKPSVSWLPQVPREWRTPLSAIAILASAASFFAVLGSALPAVAKFVLCVICLALCGSVVAYAYGMPSVAGIILLKSQRGLQTLDRVAKEHSALAQRFAEIGMVVGFGSLSYFLLDRKKPLCQRLPTVIVGTFFLVLVSSLLPVATVALLSMMSGGGEFLSAGTRMQSDMGKTEFYKYASLALLVLGGIALAVAASVIAYAGIVARAIAEALLGNAAALAQTSPGGVPILPGINLDLVQGIVALAVVLVAHEAMHGILARSYRLPLKSAGLVMFGFLPFGAFVDIDERRLFEQRKEKQNAVFVAGTAANFLTAICFFFLFAAYVLLGAALPALQFSWVARLFALIFALNLVVGAINLLPLPFFDGYYIMKNGVGNELAEKAISYVVGLSFLLTLFPWVLR